jgi:threonine/homoserine/homoserine lactone efflux protein
MQEALTAVGAGGTSAVDRFVHEAGSLDNLHLLEALLLFAAPGPTNALLAAGAVKRQNATTLLAAQACGYGIAAAFWLLLRSLVPPATGQMVQLVAAAWLVILGFRLLAAKRAGATENGGGTSILATTALNPKAFIYCVVILPMDVEAAALGIAWMALLVITALTGSMWLLLGGRLSGGKRVADAIAGAALIVFALLLLRPLIPLSAI